MSKDSDSILFEVIKFLLQAIFAVMEEEKEDRVDVYTGDTIAELGGGCEDRSMETDSKELADHESGEAVEALMDEEIGEKGPSLDIRVEALTASATLFAKWPFLTQRSLLSELVLDPFTCTEILRLHLLASGGYADHSERRLFRVHRRGNYSDADDSAIALRLRRPDLLETLAQSCVYDLSPADKLEILSTLCLQLLSYSASREHMEEAAHAAKKARRAIREIHKSEGRREKEEKARLKKQEREKVEKAKEKVDAAQATDISAGGGEEGSDKESYGLPVEGSVQTAMAEPEEGEEERKLRIAEETKALNEELVEASAMVNLQPVGSDRYHRKYWYFPSLPGLYVEDSGHFPTQPSSQQAGQGPCEQLPVLPWQKQLPPHDTVDLTVSPHKSQPPPLIHISQIEHSSSSPCKEEEKSQPPNSQLNWSCYYTPEAIEELLSSLNPRGIRELVLKKELEKMKSSILRSVQKCPFVPSCQRSPTPPSKYSCADKFLELYLREQILDIEEKIHIGTLGTLKAEEDRSKWRENIENSGAAASLVATEEDEGVVEPTGLSVPAVTTEGQSGHVTPTVSASVRELSQSLLQVQAGIEGKFLMPPLGMAVDEKKQKRGKKNGVVKESDLCLEQWRASLLKATSFSQIYLHLATLERAVMWSKSLMNVRCRICRRKTGDEYLLLCDGCDHGYHTYCLRPPLSSIPDGDWFCYNCVPVTPVKPK